MSDMREEVLDTIDQYRQRDRFSPQTMRWSGWLFSPTEGIVVTYSRKERKQHFGHLGTLADATREDFDKLDNHHMLASLQRIIMQSTKQM